MRSADDGGRPGGGLNDCGGGPGGGLNDCCEEGRPVGSGPGGGLNDCCEEGRPVGKLYGCAGESGNEGAECGHEGVSEGWRVFVENVLATDGCLRGSAGICDCGAKKGERAGGGACWKGRCGPNSMAASPWFESGVGVYAGGASSPIAVMNLLSVDYSGMVFMRACDRVRVDTYTVHGCALI